MRKLNDFWLWLRLSLVTFAAFAACGCETVANVAQGVADSARSSGVTNQPPVPPSAPVQSTQAPSSSATTAATPPTATTMSSSNSRPCVANFVSEGSFFAGYRWQSWQEHSGVTYDVAFRKVAQAVAASGWGAPTSNRDTGVITAGQAVSAGRGAIAPLNVILRQRPGGKLRIESNFSTTRGQVASNDSVRAEFCKLLEAPAS